MSLSNRANLFDSYLTESYRQQHTALRVLYKSLIIARARSLPTEGIQRDISKTEQSLLSTRRRLNRPFISAN